MTVLSRLILGARLLSARLALDGAVSRAVVGAVALGLGLWGWTLKMPPVGFAGWFNNFFRTLQLITLQFPTAIDTSIPWQLQVARLLVPLLAALATVHILVGAVTRPVRLALLPRTRGHIVVCGTEQLTHGALKTLAERGRDVVVVSASIDGARRDLLEGLGMTCVEADPLLPATFRALNIRCAAALFLTDEDELANLNRAMLAMALLATRPTAMAPLLLGVLIDNEALATELDAALDGIAKRHRVRYHRLCPDREGIRQELRTHAPVFLKPDRSVQSHILVMGLAGRWEQVLAQLIAASQDDPDRPPQISLWLDPAEAEAFAAWRAARPDLDLVVTFTVLARHPIQPPEGWAPPHLVVVLLPDVEGVAAALLLRRPGHWSGVAVAPLLVRQSHEDHLLARLRETVVQNRDFTRMAAFGGLLRAESLERVLDRRGEAVAMMLHGRYIGRAAELGAGSPGALSTWDDLPENLREANRASAEHAPILFAGAGLHVAAGDGEDELSVEDLIVLGRIEHRRWMADRIEWGWRYGPQRDDVQRLHPCLVPFDALAEADREKDRSQVRTILVALHDAGLVVVKGAPTEE